MALAGGVGGGSLSDLAAMQVSAGLLMFRRRGDGIEVLVAHPGGPYFRRRHEGVWSIPKGLIEESDDDLLAAARREFEEETGVAPAGEFLPLGSVKQSGKLVHAWAVEGDLDTSRIESGTFRIEWPPRSGVQQEFPEIDEARFVTLEEARPMMVAAQRELLDRLEAALELGTEREDS